MDRIAISGGARLHGDIPISGAKNSAIKLMAASLLTDQPLRLTNMPRLADTRFLGQLLRRLGVEVTECDGADGPETLLHAPAGLLAPFWAAPTRAYRLAFRGRPDPSGGKNWWVKASGSMILLHLAREVRYRPRSYPAAVAQW